MRILLLLLSFPAFAEMASYYRGGTPFIYALNRGAQSGTIACAVSFSPSNKSGSLKVSIHRDDDLDFSVDVVPVDQLDQVLTGRIPRLEIKQGDLTFLAEMNSTATQKVMSVRIRFSPSGYYPADRTKSCEILPDHPEASPEYLERAGEIPVLR